MFYICYRRKNDLQKNEGPFAWVGRMPKRSFLSYIRCTVKVHFVRNRKRYNLCFKSNCLLNVGYFPFPFVQTWHRTTIFLFFIYSYNCETLIWRKCVPCFDESPQWHLSNSCGSNYFSELSLFFGLISAL